MQKSTVNHPKYGEIVYSESTFWGIPSIEINGVKLEKQKKKRFVFKNEGEEIICPLKGNMFVGAYLEINGETIELSEKMKWYEYLGAILIAAVLISWGNVPALCEIIPIFGGAVGGAIAGAAAVLNCYIVKKVKKTWLKILVPLAVFVTVVVAEFVTILTILPLLILTL